MEHEPFHLIVNSPGFVTVDQRFCVNPHFMEGRYKRRKGWTLIELATTEETMFKTLVAAKNHLARLYHPTGSVKNIMP